MSRWKAALAAQLIIVCGLVGIAAESPPAAAAATVTIPADCPVVTPGTFGAAPAGALAGGTCRRLDVPAGTYLIKAYDAANQLLGSALYDADGALRCSAYYCALTAGSHYLIVESAGADFATTLVSTAAEGCTAIGDQGFSTGAYRATIGAVGEVDCLELPSTSGYFHVALAEHDRQTWPVLRLVHPSGPTSCTNSSGLITGAGCRITGDEPVRLLVTNDDDPVPGDYRLAVQNTTGPTGCATVAPQGSFGNPGGATVAFPGEEYITCLTVPAGQFAGRELFTLTRIAGGGSAGYRVYDSAGQRVCTVTTAAFAAGGCAMSGDQPYTVVIYTAINSGTYRLTHVDATGTGCESPASTAFGGVATVGTLTAPGDVRCYRTGAAWLRTHPSGVTTYLRYFDADGDLRLCLNGECALNGPTEFFLTAGAATGYAVDTWATGGDCATPTDSTAYGFGPVSGTLTAADRAYCLRVPVAPGDAFQVTGVGAATPYLISPDGTVAACPAVTGGHLCTAGTTSIGSALFALVGDDAVFQATATCATGLCDGAQYTLTGYSPITVAAGGKATITLFGTSLHLRDTVSLTRAGYAAIPAVVRTVSGDRQVLTAEVDLTAAAAGAWDVSGVSYSSASRTARVAGLVTVNPAPRLTVTKAPSVGGTVRVGSTVKAATGTFSPAAAAYTYQWTANGTAIKGATGASYTIPAAYRGKRLAVTVTARRSGYQNTAATSAAVTVGYGTAPKATKAPKITGSVRAGKTVKVSAGTWSPKADSYRYEWRLNGKVIKGATASSLKLKKAWIGRKLTVVVIAKRAGHTDGRATSAGVKVKK
ncbi:hypothetical protein [Actinoplanes sp. NPDC051851]|uniref:hypothetical protein n=1 Tax=Actinoplanes sp. NPDC051851 TaxID=3154753 RepID=UPI003422E5CD